MNSETVLFEKENFKFVKNSKNNYSLSFSMINNNIVIKNIIDFAMIKLIYDLNTDIYEKVHLEKLNENEAICSFLMKNLFQDLGLSQKYSSLHIQKILEERKITFLCQTIHSFKSDFIPEDAELLSIDKMIFVTNIINPHNVDFSVNVVFNEDAKIPNFAEKLVGVVLNKIFKRVKQFIENVRL